MLKKLVKYGNSNAIVLDRSILALLDIEENSVVRLRVEGETLLIKAEKAVKPTEEMVLEVENIHQRMSSGGKESPFMGTSEAAVRDWAKEREGDPRVQSEVKKWAPGTKNGKRLQEAFGKIMVKYQEETKSFATPEFQKEMMEINEKHGGGVSKEKTAELLKLRLKYSPNIEKMDDEMKEACIKLGYPQEWLKQPSD